MLAQLNLLYKPASATISSHEYWQQWFTAHPDARPARVEFYKGYPDAALLSFLREQKIIRSSDIEKPYSWLDYTRLKRREEKLHLPPGVYPDIANFRIHDGCIGQRHLSQMPQVRKQFKIDRNRVSRSALNLLVNREHILLMNFLFSWS